MTLASYRTLGRSGLTVSPFALGTMTFGAGRWSSDEATSRAVFDAYVEAGGNFVDTADVYSGGRSEEMLGSFVAERALRDRLVIATKSGSPAANIDHQSAATAPAISATAWRTRCSGCAQTGSISIEPTSGTPLCRSRKSCALCPMRCGQYGREMLAKPGPQAPSKPGRRHDQG